MRFGLDTQTPEDVAVKSVEIVDDTFHARYLVVEKPTSFEWTLGNLAVLSAVIMPAIIRIR